ncbi:lipid asymmetry maintenance protein MlaB [Geodermatophilus sp. SYSU D00703]
MGPLRGDGHEPPSGSFEVVHEAGGPVLHLCGDVDAPLVSQMDAGGLAVGEVVAVSVARLGYIDSTGLAMLVRWAREAAGAGRPAVLRRASPRFRQVLELTGLTPMFVLDEPRGP